MGEQISMQMDDDTNEMVEHLRGADEDNYQELLTQARNELEILTVVIAVERECWNAEILVLLFADAADRCIDLGLLDAAKWYSVKIHSARIQNSA